MLLPKMRDDFRVAVLHQAMPARLQLRPLFEVVEQLAIEDHDDVPVLIGHRLLAIREADNAQPARRQRDARPIKEALFVRAAMHDGPRHSPHDFVRHGSLLGEIDNACDAAHEYFLYFERRPLATVFSTSSFASQMLIADAFERVVSSIRRPARNCQLDDARRDCALHVTRSPADQPSRCTQSRFDSHA